MIPDDPTRTFRHHGRLSGVTPGLPASRPVRGVTAGSRRHGRPPGVMAGVPA
jgi:hypothetical protein